MAFGRPRHRPFSQLDLVSALRQRSQIYFRNQYVAFEMKNRPMDPLVGYSLLLLLAFSMAVQVTINNLKPRLDVNGNIIDAHDGSIQQFEKNGLYYVHAMQYGLCEEPSNYGCDGVSRSSRSTKRDRNVSFRN